MLIYIYIYVILMYVHTPQSYHGFGILSPYESSFQHNWRPLCLRTRCWFYIHDHHIILIRKWPPAPIYPYTPRADSVGFPRLEVANDLAQKHVLLARWLSTLLRRNQPRWLFPKPKRTQSNQGVRWVELRLCSRRMCETRCAEVRSDGERKGDCALREGMRMRMGLLASRPRIMLTV